jgi:hypothetical protein
MVGKHSAVSRGAVAVFMLTLFGLLNHPVAAQEATDAYTFRQRFTPGEAVVTDVQVRQSGTITGLGADGIPQEVQVDASTLTVTRSVEGDIATQDAYTVGFGILVTVAGQVQVDSANGRDMDLGESDPRGLCATNTVNSRGRVTATVGGASADDPLNQIERALLERAMELPEGPVRVGDRWTTGDQVKLGENLTSFEMQWRFDRVEERNGQKVPVLVGEVALTVRDITASPKSLTADIQGTPTKIRVVEHVDELKTSETIEAYWDTALSRITAVSVKQHIEAQSTQNVTLEDGSPLGSQPMSVTRDGTTVTSERPATDEELAQMAVLALANSVNRESFDLLHSVQAEGVDFSQIENQLSAMFGEHEKLRAMPSKIEFTPSGDTATTKFHVVVTGCTPEVRPGVDLSPRSTIVESDLTLKLVKQGGLWRVREIIE